MSVMYLLFSMLVCVSNAQNMERYIAAVYEHAVIHPDHTMTPVTKKEALDLMNRNMDVLEKAIKAAAEQGAHLIVTPEDGIYGWKFTRETISPYLEDIPNPEVNWIPCDDPERFGKAPVQQRLSCMAKHNSIYIVANIGDRKMCNISEVGCPADGQYNYNTAVVYDSDGKLIARYHKQHLFLGEIQFNAPNEAEVVTFETPFGRFGIFICFDILFYNPAVALVVDHNVDTIIFPTAWMNVLPHLSAIEFHSAWAMGMGVNLLSANTHNTTQRMTGSGIFSPEKIGPYYYNMDTEDGYLLISELYAHPRNSSTYNPIKWNQYASRIGKHPTGTDVFIGKVFFDEYTFTVLNEPQGNYSICQNDLCCHLSYKKEEEKEKSNEVYVLGAFDGLHVVEGEYHLQVCTLLKCGSTDLKSCGESVDLASTKFQSFSLSGNFSTDFVFPEVLLSKVHLAPNMFQVLVDGRLISQPNISSQPLLSITLFGRLYEKDPAGRQ
ncbi:pantetheinase [Spea bombifrons]|uniref:pantetheinase n=1 Tax=Spea bombifrons TaxID=233779 RepID=UPI00234B269F|nr:pantetheinase [Spea bombifrons]XP_053317339.1 pantetheinase [Spea bombifrons]